MGIHRSFKSGSKLPAIFVKINLTHLKCVVYLRLVPISTPFCGRFVALTVMMFLPHIMSNINSVNKTALIVNINVSVNSVIFLLPLVCLISTNVGNIRSISASV